MQNTGLENSRGSARKLRVIKLRSFWKAVKINDIIPETHFVQFNLCDMLDELERIM